MFCDVKEFKDRCPECQKFGKEGNRKVSLAEVPIMTEPFKDLAIFIVGLF